MFGYITINPSSLPEEQQQRFRACYCGLCHVLGQDHGAIGRMTLSYDMTFLSLLLGSLYEPPEDGPENARCPVKPWKKENVSYTQATRYAADMNIAYAYFKALDDISDDKSATARLQAAALKKRYKRVMQRYPEKCMRIEESIRRLSAMEKQRLPEADPPANCMADLFAEVFAWKDDFWKETLRTLGGAIGRFIYLCDAYEDRAEDEAKGRYNPLSAYAARPDYEQFVQRILTMVISEGAQAFEMLPLMQDAPILRNVLYSGVWSRYSAMHATAQEKPSFKTKIRRLKVRAVRRRTDHAKRRTKNER